MSRATVEQMNFLPVEAATRPTTGQANVYVDFYWAHMPGKGLMFYKHGPRVRGMGSPQCNSDRRIVERIMGDRFPEMEILQLPVVYLPHECEPY
jgi:hypothetical protein